MSSILNILWIRGRSIFMRYGQSLPKLLSNATISNRYRLIQAKILGLQKLQHGKVCKVNLVSVQMPHSVSLLLSKAAKMSLLVTLFNMKDILTSAISLLRSRKSLDWVTWRKKTETAKVRWWQTNRKISKGRLGRLNREQQSAVENKLSRWWPCKDKKRR